MWRFLIAAFAVGLAVGGASGWAGHSTWTDAQRADEWESRAQSLALQWEERNADLVARLDARDNRITNFHKTGRKLETALSSILKEVRDAPVIRCDRWGADGSVRLNRAFRGLDAAAGDTAQPGGNP